MRLRKFIFKKEIITLSRGVSQLGFFTFPRGGCKISLNVTPRAKATRRTDKIQKSQPSGVGLAN